MKKILTLIAFVLILSSCCNQNKAGIIKTKNGFTHHGFSINNNIVSYFANGFRKKAEADSLSYFEFKDLVQQASFFALDSLSFDNFLQNRSLLEFSAVKNDSYDLEINHQKVFLLPKEEYVESYTIKIKNAKKLDDNDKLDFLAMLYVNAENSFYKNKLISFKSYDEKFLNNVQKNPKVKLYNAATKKQYTAVVKLISLSNAKNKFAQYAKELKLFVNNNNESILVVYNLIKE